MSHHAPVTVSFREIAWLTICATLIAGAFLYGNADTRVPLSSAETRFVETSPSGLQIVPASCPSNPHEGGTCSENSACNIYFSPDPVAQGHSSTVYWSAPDYYSSYTLSYPGGSQHVSYSGHASVSGDQTKTYTFTYGVDGSWGSTYSCSAILTVSSDQCPAGQHLQNGICVCDGSNQAPVNGQCPNQGQCLIAFSPKFVNAGGGSTLSWSAPAAGTMSYTGGSFQVSSGPGSGNVGMESAGQTKAYTLSGTSFTSCSATLTACPAGTVANADGTACVPIQQCSPQFFCKGNDLWQKNVQCEDSFVQACTWGCSGGGCLGPPHPTGDITATPSLVRREDTTVVSWTTQHTTSCTVTENNPDITDSWIGTSGTHTSSPLTQQTIYTLTCTGIDGSTLTDRVTVNIVPIEDEK